VPSWSRVAPGGAGVELVGTCRDLCSLVFDGRERHEPLDGIIGGSLQQLQGLGQGCSACARLRVAVGPAVALELSCPGRKLAGTVVDLIHPRGELVGDVRLNLYRSSREFLRAVP